MSLRDLVLSQVSHHIGKGAFSVSMTDEAARFVAETVYPLVTEEVLSHWPTLRDSFLGSMLKLGVDAQMAALKRHATSISAADLLTALKGAEEPETEPQEAPAEPGTREDDAEHA
jgi:hypothetical protein